MENETLAQLTQTWGTPLLVAEIPADLVPEGIYLPDKIAIFPLARKKYGGCIVFANNVLESDPNKDQWTANSGDRIAITLLLDRLAAVQQGSAGQSAVDSRPAEPGPVALQWRKQHHKTEWIGSTPDGVDGFYRVGIGEPFDRDLPYFSTAIYGGSAGWGLDDNRHATLEEAKAACQTHWERTRQELVHRLTCIDATALHQHDTSDDMLYARIHRRIRLDLEQRRIERGSPYFSEKEIDDMVAAALTEADSAGTATSGASAEQPNQIPNA